MTEFETAEAAFARCHAITGHGPVVPIPRYGWNTTRYAPQPAVPNRIAELERQVADLEARNQGLCDLALRRESELEAMAAQRDHALLRMEAAIATSNSLIDAEVQRRIAKNVAAIMDRAPRAFPSRALRHQRQPGGLLCTADSGRVRLGGYAPSLPPR